MLQSMMSLHGWGFLYSLSAEPQCPLGNEQGHEQGLSPTLQGPEGGAAEGRRSLPSSQLGSTCQMSLTNPLCVHSLTREHPGRARSVQRGGTLLRVCPALQRAGGRSRASFVSLDPTKTSELCQLQKVHRCGRGLAGSCSYELSLSHVLCRHSSSVKSAMTQLHANSINPQTEPLPFWVFFMAIEKKKKNKNKSRIFLVKETKPTNQKPVGTLHEKWMVLHPRIKTNTGAKKRSSNLSSTQQKIRLHTKEKSLFLAALLPSSSTTSSLYSLKFTLQ